MPAPRDALGLLGGVTPAHGVLTIGSVISAIEIYPDHFSNKACLPGIPFIFSSRLTRHFKPIHQGTLFLEIDQPSPCEKNQARGNRFLNPKNGQPDFRIVHFSVKHIEPFIAVLCCFLSISMKAEKAFNERPRAV